MQMNATRKFLFALSVLAVSGYAGFQLDQGAQAQQRDHHERKERMCPMIEEGTTVRLEEEEDDAVTVELTTEGDVDQLRSWAERVAQRHNRYQERGERRFRGGEQQGEGEKKRKGKMIPSRAEVEEIDRGARLAFTPEDPEQVDELRDRIEHKAQRWADRCPNVTLEDS
jgi:hypothetical protein